MAIVNRPIWKKTAKDVRENRLSLRKACEKHNVKKSTLNDFLHKDECKVGAPNLLTSEEESGLAKMIDVAEWGFSLGRVEIQTMAQDLLDKKHGPSPTRYPGKDWFVNFKKRNKYVP